MTTLSVVAPARRHAAWAAAPLLGLPVAAGAALAGLLWRNPYAGLYGQDSYAYYFQARALWQDLLGQAPPPDQLFTSQALRWPIGYHLQIMLGFLAGPGPEGGRALTLLMTATAPALVYLLAGAVWTGAPARARVIAGSLAGAALLLTGTYARFGLSLMADVPALWWNVLAFYCVLRAWPPAGAAPAHRGRWAVAGGLALGAGVLVRYGSVMLVVPLLVYLALRWWAGRTAAQPGATPGRLLGWAGLGALLGLLPQAVYDLTHATGDGYSRFLSDWDPGNLFRTTLVSADGTATFSHTPLYFYLISPLADAPAGFLSVGYLPALGLGLAVLLRGRRWAVAGLLVSWWLVPALFFSGTPYQAHRFTLAFLPALTILIGLGGAAAVEGLLTAGRGGWSLRRAGLGLAALAIGLGVGLGLWQGQQATRTWVATHAGFQAAEQRLAALAEAAARATGQPGPPRVVCFGTTPALYYYTRWPLLDLYNDDEERIASFLQAPGPRLVVVPETSLATQWAGTPSGDRWTWLRAHYSLHLAGREGDFAVYTVEAGP
jgi:hypothetical protein